MCDLLELTGAVHPPHDHRAWSSWSGGGTVLYRRVNTAWPFPTGPGQAAIAPKSKVPAP